MEQILKVYIYQDGKRPIFHEPHLQGIYSSEGWFMKLMEENRQFVTRDPEKAHLFYLPYSARQLQMALYIRNSNNIGRLSIFLRDHVNMLAAKYPFWNRTHGSDHFLVACHDWVGSLIFLMLYLFTSSQVLLMPKFCCHSALLCISFLKAYVCEFYTQIDFTNLDNCF